MKNVPFNIYQKRYKKVNDNGRAKCKEGQIDKIHSYPRGGYVEFFPKIRAYAKGIVLNKTAETVHKRLKLAAVNKIITTK